MKIKENNVHIDARNRVVIELNYDEYLDLRSVIESIKNNEDKKSKTEYCHWYKSMILCSREYRIINNLFKKFNRSGI